MSTTTKRLFPFAASRTLAVAVAVAVVALTAAGCAKGTGDLDDGGVGDDAGLAIDGGGAADAGSVQPDAGVAAGGNPATGSVAGGVKAQSANYKLVGTMNKGESNASSTGYKYRGGVIGATQPQ